MVVNPFKWAGQGAILLDVKVNNVVAKAVYNPRCTRLPYPSTLGRILVWLPPGWCP